MASHARSNHHTMTSQQPSVDIEQTKPSKKIWLLSDSERKVWQELKPVDKEDFRLFSIGWKLEHDWVQHPKGPNTYGAWIALDENERHRLIEKGEKTRNPYANTKHSHLRPAEEEYCNQLPEAGKQQFRKYLFGSKVRKPHHEFPERYLIESWESANKTMKELTIDRGETIRINLLEPTRQPERLRIDRSGNSGHLYVRGVTGRARPPPTRGDLAHINSQRDGIWTFEKTLEQNEHTGPFRRIIHLFTKTDNDGNLIDRLVVKIQGWNTIRDAERQTSDEFGLHQLLTAISCPAILRCEGSSVRSRDKPPHLGYGYLEYAPWGDLDDMMARPYDPQIAEPFIWLVFRSLAEAVYSLATGRSLQRNEPSGHEVKNDQLVKAAGWESVINVDIKGPNVVLGHPQGDTPAYKSAKMIDFGLCYVNPLWKAKEKVHLGTPGFIPPEQDRKIAQYSTIAVGVHSEIFNIGLIILGLMDNQLVTYDIPRFKPKHRPDYSGTYSHNLERLALSCVEFKHSARPSLHRLLVDTREGLEKWERIYGKVKGKQADELPGYAQVNFHDDGSPNPNEFMGELWRVKKRTSDEFRDAEAEAEAEGGKEARDHQPSPKHRRVAQSSAPVDGNEGDELEAVAEGEAPIPYELRDGRPRLLGGPRVSGTTFSGANSSTGESDESEHEE